MAARIKVHHQDDVIPWKWYVYQFFSGDGVCVYVGKGCGDRFKTQQKRFAEFIGFISASFREEAAALAHEKSLIITLAPQCNKALMPIKAEPWKYRNLPDDKDFQLWCSIIGTRAMAARVLLAFRSAVDPSKLDAIRRVAYGYR